MSSDVKVLVVRYPDRGSTVAMWIDGQEVVPDVIHVDPGAGHRLREWRGALANHLADDTLPQALARDLREEYEGFETSRWIEDDTTEDDSVEVWCGQRHGEVWCEWNTGAADVDAAVAAIRAHRAGAAGA